LDQFLLALIANVALVNAVDFDGSRSLFPALHCAANWGYNSRIRFYECGAQILRDHIIWQIMCSFGILEKSFNVLRTITAMYNFAFIHVSVLLLTMPSEITPKWGRKAPTNRSSFAFTKSFSARDFWTIPHGKSNNVNI